MRREPIASEMLLLGATGLVGGALLQRLLVARGDDARPIWAPLRRSPAVAHPALRAMSIDPGQAMPDEAEPTAFVCCLGTTLRQAGSAEKFVAVDRDLVLQWAQRARQSGANHALLVSSVGADPASRNLYLRTKGEVERGLGALGFARLDILRPGLLIGQRGGPVRPAESLGQVMSPLLDRLLLGRLRRYRSIAATQVAAALFNLLDQRSPGVFIHQHDQLLAWAQR